MALPPQTYAHTLCPALSRLDASPADAADRLERVPQLFLDALFVAFQSEKGRAGFAEDLRWCAGLCTATWNEEALWNGLAHVRRGKLKRTHLMYAAQRGDVARVRWLLARGAPTELRDRDKHTALFWAAEGLNKSAAAHSCLGAASETDPHVEVVRVLLATGAAVALHYGESRLNFACKFEGVDVVRRLIAEGGDVNELGSKCPIHFAAEFGFVEVVKDLLSMGADPNIRVSQRWHDENNEIWHDENNEVTWGPQDNWSALYIACRKGRLNIARALIQGGADMFAAFKTTCGFDHDKSVDGPFSDMGAFRSLLAAGFDVAAAYDGERPLVTAAACKNVDMVLALLAEGADANAVNNFGNAPLHVLGAARYYHYHTEDSARLANARIVRALFNAGSDVDAVGYLGRRPLHVAASSEDAEFVLMLLEQQRADVNAAAASGDTPLHLACTDFSAVDTVAALLAAGADVNAVNKLHWRPLHTASQSICTDIVRLLVERGAEVNATGSGGETALHIACRNYPESNNNTLVKVLLAAGADPNAVDHAGWRPLDDAAELDPFKVEDSAITCTLLEAGALSTKPVGSGRGWRNRNVLPYSKPH